MVLMDVLNLFYLKTKIVQLGDTMLNQSTESTAEAKI